MILWSMLAACAVPALDALEPGVVRPGAELTVRGSLLGSAEGLTLRASDGGTRELRWASDGETVRTAAVPSELASGVWEVRLATSGWRSPKGLASLEVWRPETEPPCQRRFALKVLTERTPAKVVISWLFEGDEAETHTFEGDELVDVVAVGDEACRQVVLRTRTQGDWLLSDGSGPMMTVQAEALAEALGLRSR